MIAVLNPLRHKGGLVGAVVEWRGRGVEGRQRRRIEQRLDTRIALGDVDDIAMNIVDRASDELSEIGAQHQRAGRRVGVLHGSDFFVELIDDDLGVQIGEVVDLRNCRSQHLLHADEIRDDQVDLIRADAADLAGGCIVE